MSTLRSIIAVVSTVFIFNNAYAEEHQVKMLSKGAEGQFVFEPSVLKVVVGDTVVFVPTQPGHDSISVFTPPNANTWHGRRGQEVRVEINQEGVYIYKCAPHYYYGMFGVIYTDEINNLDEAKVVASEHSKKFLAHKERLNDYLGGLSK